MLTGWGHADYWFPPIRSLGGAIVVMTLVLYPYVYLLARAAFLEQCTCMLDVSRTLGRGPWNSFLEVAVPLARPAIAGGVALALMEALADFGTVQYFGVNTFTTGIYRTWFALGEPVAAAQLAAVLMLVVLLVLAAERWSRGLARYQHTAQSRLRPCYDLRGAWAALALRRLCDAGGAGLRRPGRGAARHGGRAGRPAVRRHVRRARREQPQPRRARRGADRGARDRGRLCACACDRPR